MSALRSPRERHLRRVSKDETSLASWFETAQERLLAMRERHRRTAHEQRHRTTHYAEPGLCRVSAELRRQTLRRNPGAGFLLLQSRQIAGRSRSISQADRRA